MKANDGDYEKLGQFYLGREYDAAGRQVTDRVVLYDSRDLVTHGVVLGMTGSGKTGLCLAMLEEAAMDQIPAIVIDPKGDLGNLLLLFPELDGASFRPWIQEEDAARKQLTADAYAAQTAAQWRDGLAEWGQGAERIRRLHDSVEINLFTPGSKAGVPVSILSSLAVPPAEVMEDAELLGERIENTVGSLLSLVGMDAEPGRSPEAALLGAVFGHAWAARRQLTLDGLIAQIQKPPFDKVGVMDLESFLPEKARQALALKFNNLLASPAFATWLEGVPLDIASMLYSPAGKPRVSIFSIAHLGDAERMFFVSLLLNELLGWMRGQRGTTSLRALLYMDEIFGYLPPSANPPSKRPLMTLLKQGRAFGVGCLLATQNPVDLDYKALSNIGSWFLGRLQTERDKLRVLDGLEGVAGAQAARFDRAEMERLLAGLDQRVFLLNNVHEDHPVLFHVRWAMSYLAGPLTRSQIKVLMDPKRAQFAAASVPSNSSAANPMSRVASGVAVRPVVGPGVDERFMPPAEDRLELIYQPHLWRSGTVGFAAGKHGAETWRPVCEVHPMVAAGIDWDHPVAAGVRPEDAVREPVAAAQFGELPGFAMNAANYKQVAKEFADWLYQNVRVEVWACPALTEWSAPDEAEGAFRARLGHRARELRDAAVADLRQSAAKRLGMLESRLRSAQGQLAKQQAEANAAKMQAGASLLGGLLGGLLGRKGGLGSLSGGTAMIGRATRAYTQHQDVTNAADKIAGIEEEIAALRAELESAIAQIAAAYQPESLVLERHTLKPAKSAVRVDGVGLLWLPYDARGERAW